MTAFASQTHHVRKVAVVEASQVNSKTASTYDGVVKPKDEIFVPHIAGYGRHVAKRHLEVVLDNLARFDREEPPAQRRRPGCLVAGVM